MTVAAELDDPPAPVDLLAEAIERGRPMVSDRARPIADRLLVFWAVAKHAAGFAAWDVHESEFLRFARETGLARDLGRYADEDVRHVIDWARRGLNPFATGPLDD
jgi:hypothetical protein